MSGFSPAAYKVATAVPAPVLASGLAATEGAAFGFEGDGLQEKAQNAATTAAISAVVPFAFKGAGTAINAASKTKIAQQLGDGADFVNLMFTEHAAAPLYQHVVSRAFGAATLVEQQVRSVAGRAASSSRLLANKVDLAGKAKASLESSKRVLKGNRDVARRGAEEIRDETQASLTLKGRLANNDLDATSASRVDALNNLENKTSLEIKAAAVKEADAATNAAEAAWRSRTLTSALPSGAPRDIAESLPTLNPQDALKSLDSVWQQYGFQSAKRNVFAIQPQKIIKSIEQMLDKNPEAFLALKQNGNLKTVAEFITKKFESSVEGGRINGEDLVDLRSKIGTLLNGISEDKSLVRGYVKDIQNHFDDIIISQLSKKDAADFLADRALWRNRSVANVAVETATGRNKAVQGAYTAEDWIVAAKSESRGLAARGDVVLQKEAQEQVSLNTSRNKQITELADLKAKELAETAKRQLTAERAALKQAKEEAIKRHVAEKKAIVDQFRGSKRTADLTMERNLRLQQATAAHKEQLLDFDGRIAKAAAQEKEITNVSSVPVRGLGLFAQMFATGILGAVMGPVGIGAGLTGGVGVARTLAAQGTQRALAGQTAPQMAVQRGMQRLGRGQESAMAAGFGVPQAGAAVVGSEQRAENIFTPETRATIAKLPKADLKKVWEGLVANGQDELLKEQDPRFYNYLKRAAQ
jgi:hypothetical protein